ncbi:MAG TPA: L,D-transpeptidase [Chloroflexia bacterium]
MKVTYTILSKKYTGRTGMFGGETEVKGRYRVGMAALMFAVALIVVASLAGQGAGQAHAQEGARIEIKSEVATIADTNLLGQPAEDGPVVANMPVNSRAIVIGGPFNDGWYWLDYSGVQGYAHRKSLVLVDANYRPVPSATPVPTSPPPPTATPTPGTVFEMGPGKYEGLWLGEMAHKGNVWNGPGQGKIIKSWWAGRRVLLYEGITDVKGALWYRVSEEPEAPMYVQASMVKKIAPVKFEAARYRGRWVNINISQQVVTAYEDGTPVMVSLASTGTGKNPTELGVWKIFYRLPKQDMKGGSRATGDYYYLKDVPYPQYFHSSGEGLHGTYWHDNFGRPMSHGCINLSTPIAGWFYRWASIGTVVYTHY